MSATWICPKSSVIDITDPDLNRRILAPGFSEKALRDQEPYMKKYFDLLIQRLHENCGQPVNMVDWYHLTTFDLIGDLTFGESFDCLETSKMHVRKCLSCFTSHGC